MAGNDLILHSLGVIWGARRRVRVIALKFVRRAALLPTSAQSLVELD